MPMIRLRCVLLPLEFDSLQSHPPMDDKSYFSPTALEDPRYREAMRMVVTCCN